MPNKLLLSNMLIFIQNTLDNEDVDVNNYSQPVNIQPGRHPGSPLSVTDQLVLASDSTMVHPCALDLLRLPRLRKS